METEKLTEYFQFQINRKITNLYKGFLVLLEDLRQPPYNLSDEVHKRLRKKVLDASNDTIRELEEDINKVNIILK